MPETLFNELYGIAKRAGSAVAGHNQGFVTQEDMVQEAMAWLIGHPEQVEKQRDVEGNLYVRRLYHITLRHLIPLARASRAAVFGAPADDQKYNARMVRNLLPCLWSDEHAARPESEIRTHNDPALGGTWAAMVVDVRNAFERIGTKEQAVLLLRYGLSMDWPSIALKMSAGEPAVRVRASRAITAMTDWLNGLSEYTFEPAGTRKVQSNARARFTTDTVYNGEGA